MKTKLIINIALFILVFNTCKTAKYLPQSNAIDINQYGSYININLINGKNVKGELIAVNSKYLNVLIDTGYYKKVTITPLNLIKRFNLFYAKPKGYGWSIPVFTLSTIFPFPDPAGGGLMPFHGVFAIISVPVNIIVTSVVTRNAFRYNATAITYEQLKMFARYPQGIPESVDITSIK